MRKRLYTVGAGSPPMTDASLLDVSETALEVWDHRVRHRWKSHHQLSSLELHTWLIHLLALRISGKVLGVSTESGVGLLWVRVAASSCSLLATQQRKARGKWTVYAQKPNRGSWLGICYLVIWFLFILEMSLLPFVLQRTTHSWLGLSLNS